MNEHDPVSAWPRWPQIPAIEQVRAAVTEVLESRCWTVRAPGPRPCFTERVEQAWAERCAVPHALAVCSGSAALELALRGLGVRPGDEIIVPALTWYATAAAVVRACGVPVFADVDPASSCVDAAAVAAAITSRTVGIIVVHLHCAVAPLDELLTVARRHGLFLIEDAAQAHGGRFGGRAVGAWGDVGCFSFNQEKLVAAGEAGAVVTSDSALYRRMFALRTDGYAPVIDEGPRSFRPLGEIQGGNLCPSELVAALLLHQIEAFDAQDVRRRSHAIRLEAALARLDGISTLATAPGTDVRPYYEFGIVLTPALRRGRTIEALGSRVSAALGAPVHPTDVPVPGNALWGPKTQPVPPGARALWCSLLVFHHSLLLDERVVDAVPRALRCLDEDTMRGSTR